MIDQPTTPNERFATIRAEARRRIEARNRATNQLARKMAAKDATKSDTSDQDNFDEFEARLYADISEWLDKEDQYRTVTIEELMQIGRSPEEKW